jgi:hypothetical protein
MPSPNAAKAAGGVGLDRADRFIGEGADLEVRADLISRAPEGSRFVLLASASPNQFLNHVATERGKYILPRVSNFPGLSRVREQALWATTHLRDFSRHQEIGGLVDITRQIGQLCLPLLSSVLSNGSRSPAIETLPARAFGIV